MLHQWLTTSANLSEKEIDRKFLESVLSTVSFIHDLTQSLKDLEFCEREAAKKEVRRD